MTVKSSTYQVATRIVSGVGTLVTLPEHVRSLPVDLARVALVHDAALAGTSVLPAVMAALDGIAVGVVLPVEPDPTLEAGDALAAVARAAWCNVVVAVGGGSALGAAKAVALLLTNQGSAADYRGWDRGTSKPAPSVAIPTTAGSGSEVSNALVLRTDEQVVVRGRGYEPTVAVLDGELLVTLPDRPMLYAGLDALSHCYEALWSVNSSTITDALAIAAAGMIRSDLPTALQERDVNVLQRLLEASTMANMACGNTGLGLVHALSSTATVELPHGLQNGVLLPYVARFNAPAVRPAVRTEIDAIDTLYDVLGFDASFDGLGLTDSDFEAMVASALANEFAAINIRPATRDELVELVLAAAAPLRVHDGAGVTVGGATDEARR